MGEKYFKKCTGRNETAARDLINIAARANKWAKKHFKIAHKTSSLLPPPSQQLACRSPERPAGIPVDLGNVVGQELHEGRDAAQLARLGLDRIVHVAEVLEVRGCIGFDHTVRVVEELNDLVQVRVAPLHTGGAWRRKRAMKENEGRRGRRKE